MSDRRPQFAWIIADPRIFCTNGIVIAPAPKCSKRTNISKLTYKGDSPMLWTILVILLVLWLIGFLGHVGGGLIHLLLVIALIVFIINLVSGRRAV
jgi:hypothetical protein